MKIRKVLVYIFEHITKGKNDGWTWTCSNCGLESPRMTYKQVTLSATKHGNQCRNPYRYTSHDGKIKALFAVIQSNG